MDRRYALAGLLTLVAVSGAATVAVGTTPPLQFGDEDPAFEETSLHTFEPIDTRCAAERTEPDATVSRPVPGGRRVHINQTIDVDAHDTTLSASLDRFGPGRYVLDVARDPGAADANCDLSVRYNATLNVSTPDDFTLVVTHDDRLVGTYFSDADASGGSGSASAGGSAGGSSATASDRET